MRFRVLGAVEVVGDDGVVVPVGSPSQRRLLAALLARPGEWVPVDALIEAVWGESPPPTAVTTLRTYVSRLRGVVGEHLESGGPGYRLAVPAHSVDAGRFDALVAEARRSGGAGALALLDEALACWQGPAFGDLADLACVRAEARRLDVGRFAAREEQARALLATGRVDEAVAEAEALVTAEPLREEAWIVLVAASALAGRQADALRAYQRAVAALGEVGLEPSDTLRATEQRVVSGDLRATATTGPTLPAVVAERYLPPVHVSSFVGRAADCERVQALLEEARVVTLVGPGGVGKTRLATEVARRGSHHAGVCFVELARVEAGSVADAVIGALGITSDRDSAWEVVGRAGRLDVLLVLDNAEHVIDAVAGVAERLLAVDGPLGLLVTSRERLGVAGEHVWEVAPLDAAERGSAAARLFVERARAAVPHLALSVDDESVARVCARLDGLPLALEMAAAQLSTVSVDELAATLDQGLGGLRSPRRLADDRHQSLGALLAWSEARLDDDLARAFAEFSVFAGPVTAEDVAGVLGGPDAVARIRDLAERSLVAVDRAPDRVRFSMLQIVRSYAASRLAESGRTDELARRHAVWFTSVAAGADAVLRTAEEGRGARRLDDVLAELRAAHQWARTGDITLATELSAHLHVYAQSRLMAEPLRWADELLAVAPPDARLGTVYASAAARAINRGDLDQAGRLAQEGIELGGDSRWAMAPHESLGDVTLYGGRPDESRAHYGELARLATEHDDPHFLSVGHTGVTLASLYAGAPTEIAVELLDLEHQLPPSSQAWLAYTRGELLGDREAEAAFACFEQALALSRSVGNRFIEGVTLVSASALRARVGDIVAALRSFDEVIRHWEQLADATHQHTTLRNLAALYQRAGLVSEVAVLLGALDAGAAHSYGDEAERLRTVRTWAHGELGPDRFAELTSEGVSLGLDGAVERSLAVIGDRLRDGASARTGRDLRP